MRDPNSQQIAPFQFPNVERKVFERNFLDTVAIELRYPTYLRLKEKEPLGISDSIRKHFPVYEQSTEMQMTSLGTTDQQPVYRFTTRKKDPVLSISASNLVLATERYKSFEDFTSHIEFLIEKAIPHLDTTFFTRVGLRSNEARKFVLDWDYYREDVEVADTMSLLTTFHGIHFPFFWWALGEKAKMALNNGTANT